MLAKPIGKLHRVDEKAVEDCEIILDSYSLLAKEVFEDNDNTKANNKDWAHGRKHIFLSEGARQQLESLRIIIRKQSATRIQATFRGFLTRRKLAMAHKVQSVNNNLMKANLGQGPSNLNQMVAAAAATTYRSSTLGGRPKPISGTPPPMEASSAAASGNMHTDKCDFRTIQLTCSLFGLDLVSTLHLASTVPHI